MIRLEHWRDYLAVTALTAADGTNTMLMPLLLGDAGYSAAQIGPLVAILGIASLASRFPAGALYRPTRARWLLGVSLIVAAVSSQLYPYVTESVPLFVLVRVLNGLASGTATTVNLALFIDSLPAGAGRARLMGLYGGGMAAGFTLGNLTGGVAADLFGYPISFGLGALYWMIGLCQALTTRVAAEAPSAGASARPAGKQANASRVERLRATLHGLADPKVADVTAMSFALNAQHHIGTTFFPLLARGVGLGLSEIGLVRAAYSCVNAIARPITTPVIMRLGASRAASRSFSAQAGLIACIPLVAVGGFPAFLALFALSGGARAIAFTGNATALAEDIPESRLSRGLSASLFNAAKDLGNIAGPLIGSGLAPLVGLERMFVAGPGLLLLLYLGVVGGARWLAGPTSRATA